MEHTSTLIPYFLYALGILYREGMEAMLVVVALAAGTREAGRGQRARAVYLGASLAIAASVILAWTVNHLIGDNASDTLEGVFQMLAAATLFYVSSWLTAKTQSDRWRGFISTQVEGARQSALPWFAIGLSAFLAVMREGAETIVFFEALTAGATESAERHAVALGVVAGALALAVTFVVLNRAAYKIPIRPLFRFTSYLLYGLAIVFIGQGVASFQESGLIHATFIPHAPTMSILGIFPTVQSLGAQFALLLVAAAAIVVPRGMAQRAQAAGEGPRPGIRPT